MSKLDSENAILNRHDFDTTFTATFNADTPGTGTAVLTPSTSTQLQVVGIQVDTAATSGSIRFRFTTSADVVAKFYASSASATQFFADVYKVGALNEVLTMTSTFGTSEFTVTICYKLV